MITRILASAAALTISSVALALGAAAPANAAGNNVVNAHCDDIVLDLKDNPLEADSRGEVVVNVNGRIIYTGALTTADYHQVLTDFPRHDTGYEWSVTITHPFTGRAVPELRRCPVPAGAAHDPGRADRGRSAAARERAGARP